MLEPGPVMAEQVHGHQEHDVGILEQGVAPQETVFVTRELVLVL